MTEYIEDSPQSNPNFGYATQQGGYQAPNETQVRIQLALNDSMMPDSSLINTKNEFIGRQWTMSPSITAPEKKPDNSPIAEIPVDRLFEKLKVTEKEHKSARQKLEKHLGSSTASKLIRYLEMHGGPTNLDIDTDPPEEGFPPGVTIDALRSELGHNLWAMRNVLNVLPNFIVPIRKMHSILKNKTKKTSLKKRKILNKKHYSASETVKSKDPQTQQIFNYLRTGTPILSSLLTHFFTQVSKKQPPGNLITKTAFSLAGEIVTTAHETLYTQPESISWRYLIEKYVEGPLGPLYEKIADFLLIELVEMDEQEAKIQIEDNRSVILAFSALIIGVGALFIEQLNDDSESPSKSQKQAAGSILVILSNEIYGFMLKTALDFGLEKIFCEICAAFISVLVLILGRDILGNGTLSSLDEKFDFTKQTTCFQVLESYSEANSEKQEELATIHPQLALLFQQYAIDLHNLKTKEPTSSLLIESFEETFGKWLKLETSALAQVVSNITPVLKEWFKIVNPIKKGKELININTNV